AAHVCRPAPRLPQFGRLHRAVPDRDRALLAPGPRRRPGRGGGRGRRQPMSMSGPITGGERGRPWSAPQADLDERGYVMEEFFVDGTATSYRLKGDADQTPDGQWQAQEDDRAPFRTRLLVVRPSEASAFNGTVVVHWLNVTAGYELGTADDD